jgi:hypothetical protein
VLGAPASSRLQIKKRRGRQDAGAPSNPYPNECERGAVRLPADLPGTDLLRDEAVYWQVLMEVPLTGPDLEAVFLAPVYEKRSR